MPQRLFGPRASRFTVCFVVVLAVMALTMMRFCNLQFRCGCTAVASSRCNVHHLTQPHCPWCAHLAATGIGVVALVLPSSAGSILFAMRWRPRGLAVPLVAGLAGYVFGGGLLGLISTAMWHYPTWLGIRIGY